MEEIETDLEDIILLGQKLKSLLDILKNLDGYNIQSDISVIENLLKLDLTNRKNFLKCSNDFWNLKDKYVNIKLEKYSKSKFKMKLKKCYK